MGRDRHYDNPLRFFNVGYRSSVAPVSGEAPRRGHMRKAFSPRSLRLGGFGELVTAQDERRET